MNKIKEVIDSVGSNADNLTTTRHEEEQERSDRHALDMASDSFLSKSIRPFVLIFLLLLFSALSLVDMLTDYKINDSFLSIIKNWGDLVFMFYFASRGVEKIAKIANRQIRFLKRNERKENK